MIKRHLEPALKNSKKSILLLGPRQTGKSTLIHALAPDLAINLAHEPTYVDFARNPSEIEQRLSAHSYKTILIDEIQRLPRLLNTLQVIMDEKPSLKFYLTGSSARKLRGGRANLLPGRIHSYSLGPLTVSELQGQMELRDALSTGTLPGIWTEPDKIQKQKTLQSYAVTYLKEEIQSEALTKNIEGFSRFLFVTASEAGKFLDLSKLASEAKIPRQSAVRYFEILEDTLILRRCEAFAKSSRKRLIQSPRFFFFDNGILNGLLNNFVVSQDRIGPLFECFIFNQLVHSAAARDADIRISSYRTASGAEVDFIVECGREILALEVKASKNISPSDLRGLKSFREYYKNSHRAVLAYLGSVNKIIDKIEIMPWQNIFKLLGL